MQALVLVGLQVIAVQILTQISLAVALRECLEITALDAGVVEQNCRLRLGLGYVTLRIFPLKHVRGQTVVPLVCTCFDHFELLGL